MGRHEYEGMTRSTGVRVSYPPEEGLRMVIPGSDTKMEVRKVLRWPALCERLEGDIKKKKAADRSLAAMKFMALVKADRRKVPIPTSPSTVDGLTPADLLMAARSDKLCRLLLSDDDLLREDERAVRDVIRSYQDSWV